MKKILLLLLLLTNLAHIQAQDTTIDKTKKQAPASDTLRVGHAGKRGVGSMTATERKKLDYFRDTIRRVRRKFDSTLFTEITVPSTSDYAKDLGHIYELLNDETQTMGNFNLLPDIRDFLARGDTALEILRERVLQNDHSFHIRNLQMFNSLLDALDNSTDHYSDYLERYDSTLDHVQADISDLRKDTLMKQIFRDSTLKNMFQAQLQQLKVKWREVDSMVSEYGREINTLKSQSSAHAITIDELLTKVDGSLEEMGSHAFGKERHFLWESASRDSVDDDESFNSSLPAELQMAGIYFANTTSHRNWLIVIALVFFFWVWINFRSLKRLDKLDVVAPFHLHFINPYPIIASFIFALSFAPLFDLRAPSIYLESIQLLLIILLTSLFWKHIERALLRSWCVFVLLFLLFMVFRVISMPLDSVRWVNLVLNGSSAAFGLYFLFRHPKNTAKWNLYVVSFYVLLNTLAVLSNILGRISLAQIFGYTAIYSFAQAVSLGIFVQIVREAFILQIQTSRVKRNYALEFNYAKVSRAIMKFSMLVAVPLWLIVFASNLNLFDALYDWMIEFFTRNHQVGNFSFTVGGVLLFLGIIWLSNVLQKYIGYFFGDTGDDPAFDDKGQRSRLMITRLILLIAGFLLAVAASGLSVDRITVVLGALGVGVGLGLQNIVNNFVSGVILIFDRPLRIGDTVDIGDKRGRVKEIGIRTSTLLTEEGAEVIIPNGDVLSNKIINWTHGDNRVRQQISFTLDKPANKDQIKEETIQEIVHKNPNVISERKAEIIIDTMSSKNMQVKIFFWIKDFNTANATTSEIKTELFQWLENNGLNII